MKRCFDSRFLIGFVVLALAAPGFARETRPLSDFAGNWELNRSESQPPQAGPQGPARRPGSSPEGPAAARRPGDGPGLPGRPDGPRGRMGGAESIQVSVDGQSIQLAMGGGRERVLVVDGRPRKQQRGFTEFTSVAEWQDGAVVVTATAPDGPRIKESFALAGDGSGRLIHTVVMTRPGAEAESRGVWVYDRK